MIDVSVIIPMYNAAPYIDRCFKSLEIQKGCSFEIVAVNDGSKDATKEAVKPWKEKFGKNLKYIEQENKGAAAARNRGLTEARGRIVSFLDADDEYLEGRLEKYVRYFDTHPDVGVVYSEPVFVSDGKETRFYTDNGRKTCEGWVYKDLLSSCYVILSTVACRRELLQANNLFFDESLKFLEDCDMWLRLARITRFGFINEPLSRQNLVPGSLTRGSDHSEISRYSRLLIEKHKKYIFEKIPCPGLFYAKKISEISYDDGVNEMKNGNIEEAEDFFRKAYSDYPFSLKPLIKIAKMKAKKK